MHFTTKLCLLCEFPTGAELGICAACRRGLPWQTSCCRVCAHPLEHLDDQLLCGRCQRHPPPYQRSIAPLLYRFPLDRLLGHLKYQRGLYCATTLGGLLVQGLQQSGLTRYPQALVPVPLHPERFRRRPYNQATLIARQVSAHFRIPIYVNWCRRSGPGGSQTRLNRRARTRNLQQGFTVRRAPTPPPRYVAIIDDVMTTGATVEALTHTLQSSGVQEVAVWCVARTPDNGDAILSRSTTK